MAYIGQTSRDLTHRYREHIRYIRNNEHQTAYAQYSLRNQHEYGTKTDTVTLFKPTHKTPVLIPCDQLFIQTFHHNGNLITEQSRDEQNLLFQIAIDTGLTSHPIHNRPIPPTRYTWNSSNSTTRADGSRPGCVEPFFIRSVCYTRNILRN
jgi:hypothetical protein